MTSSYVRAIRLLCGNETLNHILAPHFDEQKETLDFEAIKYGALSGGEKVAISWAYVLWTGMREPKGWRHPLVDFFVLDDDLRQLVLSALEIRANG